MRLIGGTNPVKKTKAAPARDPGTYD